MLEAIYIVDENLTYGMLNYSHGHFGSQAECQKWELTVPNPEQQTSQRLSEKDLHQDSSSFTTYL